MFLDLLTNATGQQLGNFSPLYWSFAVLYSIENDRVFIFGPTPLDKARLECLKCSVSWH
jgi:hypothetical protein